MLMESTIARWHVQGWNVAFREGFVVFDDRLLNAAIIRQLPRCPDRVVLGSSRCMQLRQEHLSTLTCRSRREEAQTEVQSQRTEKRTDQSLLTSAPTPGGDSRTGFFNHAMRRAVLEDQVTLWQLYRRRGWRPARVLLGVDAWLLDGGYWKDYWLTLRGAFGEIIRDWQLPYPTGPAQWDTNCRARKGEELRASTRLKNLAAGLFSWTGTLMFKTHADGLKEYVRRGDGSVSYHAAFRERPAAEVREIIGKSVRFPRHPLSPEMTALLEAFVARLAGDGVEITFVIPPYHPAFLKLASRNAAGEPIDGHAEYLATLERVGAFIRALAEKYQARVLGSFDSMMMGAGQDEFFDWMHAKPQVFERLLRS